MPYLLDTDSASLAFKGNERVRARIRQASSPGVWLSIIAAEEITRGALAFINTNRDKAAMIAAYVLFSEALQSICEYRIHPYDAQAARVFASFPASVRRIGSQDCRIAASAIAAGWTVVTVNQKDFSRIPGVQFEDWSR